MQKQTNPEQQETRKVSEMSTQEYAKRKGVEIPVVNFVGIPCVHAMKENGEKVIEILKKEKPDLVILEDLMNFYGKDYVEELKMCKRNKNNLNDPYLSFYIPVIEYLINSNIPVTPLERRFENDIQAINYYTESIKGLDISDIFKDAIKISDDDESWNFLCVQRKRTVDTFIDKQKEREEVMLSHISPAVTEYCRTHNQKENLNVSVILGAMHSDNIFGHLKNRGDNVSIPESDFTKDKSVQSLHILKGKITFLGQILGCSKMYESMLAGISSSLSNEELKEKEEIISKLMEIFIKMKEVGTLTSTDEDKISMEFIKDVFINIKNKKLLFSDFEKIFL